MGPKKNEEIRANSTHPTAMKKKIAKKHRDPQNKCKENYN